MVLISGLRIACVAGGFREGKEMPPAAKLSLNELPTLTINQSVFSVHQRTGNSKTPSFAADGFSFASLIFAARRKTACHAG